MTAVDWTGAACVEHEPELWHPSTKAGPRGSAWDEPRAICRACPIRPACLAYAMETGQDHGMWGGLDENERANLRRRRKRKSQSRASA